MRGWAPKRVQKHGTSAGQMDVERAFQVCLHFFSLLTCGFMSDSPWSAGKSNLKCSVPRLASKGRLELKQWFRCCMISF